MMTEDWDRIKAQLDGMQQARLATQDQDRHVHSNTCPCEDCRKIFRPTLDERMERHRTYGGKVAKRIEIEYDDGEVWRAEGADAFEILDAMTSAQSLFHARSGTAYTGPQMKKVSGPLG